VLGQYVSGRIGWMHRCYASDVWLRKPFLELFSGVAQYYF